MAIDSEPTAAWREYHVEKSLGTVGFGIVMSVRRKDFEDAASAPGPFVAYCTQASNDMVVHDAHKIMEPEVLMRWRSKDSCLLFCR